jgi:predicted dehydrogenase
MISFVRLSSLKHPQQGTDVMAQRNVSRRRFLKSSLAVASGGIAMPYFVPSHVLAAPGRAGANDRINIAHIGTGGMGMGHVQGGAVAICDVDDKHIAAAVAKTGGKPFTCRDYRSILDRKDVDAVMIATPDHWHALQTVHACQAGKDVYSEKPTCRTIQEGQAMINATNHFKRVVQIGSQGRSNPSARSAAQFVRNGQLGKVDRVEIWHPTNYTGGQAADGPVPAELDWDLWLGPIRWRDYNPEQAHFNFRWMMDSGGGFVRDRGNHILSIVMWAMGADQSGPISVEAVGEPDKQGRWDVPVSMDVKWEFKNPEWALTWSQPGRQRPFPGSQRNIDWGAEFYGDKDSLIVEHGDGHCDTEERAKMFEPPSDGVTLPRSPGHRENWLQCIASRERPIMPVETGVNVIHLPIMANISYQLGRKLHWDAAKLQFVGDDEANRFIAQPYRAPWRL